MYYIYNKPISALLLVTACLLIILTTGCSQAQDVLYLEDLQPGIAINVQDPRPIKLLPGDKVSISVHSRDKELVEMFNLGSLQASSGGGQTLTAYTVDDNGKIEMPIIGSVHVKGLTRLELQNIIRYKLLASKLVRDPIVSVEYVDMGYYVMGELSPARHKIERDNITLIEAIAECGDLSISGRRDNIMVLRTIEGQQTPYFVNITKTADLYGSPVYYLQQNDIIYVQPNETKINSQSPLGNSTRNPMFWLSTFNVVLSFVLMFTK